MHVLKLICLLLLTLAIMRVVSWALGWLSFRFGRLSRRPSTLIGNAGSFLLFAGFLWRDTLPGEPFDSAALVFALVTFSVFQIIDLKWCWWDPRPDSGGPKRS